MTSAEACEAVRRAFEGGVIAHDHISMAPSMEHPENPYLTLEAGADVATLDGDLTASQLRALADWMDAHAAQGEGEPSVCTIHCSVCEGLDHHWMPVCDDESGEPQMECKHCGAVREYTDND